MLIVLHLTGGVLADSPFADWLGLELLVVGPWQSVGPRLVTQPVTDKVLVSSIDKNRNIFFQQVDDVLVVRLHPVTSKHEVAVDIKVARLVLFHFHTQLFLDFWQVQILVNVLQVLVAQAGAFTHGSNVIHVTTSLLVWTHLRIVTVDGSWDT